MTTEKKFSLCEILTVSSGCTVTQKCPVALIEHVTGWKSRDEVEAVTRYRLAQLALHKQLPWLKEIAVPSFKNEADPAAAKSAFVAATAIKYGAEHSVKTLPPPPDKPSIETLRALHKAGISVC